MKYNQPVRHVFFAENNIPTNFLFLIILFYNFTSSNLNLKKMEYLNTSKLHGLLSWVKSDSLKRIVCKNSMFFVKMHVAFISILFVSYGAFAGDYILVKTIPVKTHIYTTDHFGNSYIVNSHGTILKYDSLGELSATYSQKDFGVPQSIDASDPFKILIFYSNFATIRFLDNKLALQSTINLNSIGIQQPLLACNSINQTGFWVYDEIDFTIKKINNQLKVEVECQSLNKIHRDVHVNFLCESESWIMINNLSLGVMVFNKNGDYFHTIKIQEQPYFQAQYDQLFYVKNDTIQMCNIGSLERNIVKLPPMKGVIDMRIEPHRVFVRKKETIEIYSF